MPRRLGIGCGGLIAVIIALGIFSSVTGGSGGTGTATGAATAVSSATSAVAVVTSTPTVAPSATPTAAPSATATARPTVTATPRPAPSHTPATAATIALTVGPAPSGRVGPASAYPPPSSPGAVDPRVTQANIHTTICVSGYTATVRPPVSYTEPLKRQQLAALALPGGLADYEEDHVVPLEVGGAPSDPRNLFPEHYREPYGAHEKDRVENYLHDQVCSGAMALADAQRAIEVDWVAVYQRVAGPAPAASATPAPASGDGHTYYASGFRTAHTIYCDTDPEWKSLSPKYLQRYPTLAAAEAAHPTYTLHRGC